MNKIGPYNNLFPQSWQVTDCVPVVNPIKGNGRIVTHPIHGLGVVYESDIPSPLTSESMVNVTFNGVVHSCVMKDISLLTRITKRQ